MRTTGSGGAGVLISEEVNKGLWEGGGGGVELEGVKEPGSDNIGKCRCLGRGRGNFGQLFTIKGCRYQNYCHVLLERGIFY